MKKTVLAFVAILSLALLLAGCGQTTSESTSQAGQTPAPQEPTTQSATETTIQEPIASAVTPAAEETTEEPIVSADTTAVEETTTVSDTSSAETIEVAGCSDTDDGKDYGVAGSLVDAHGVTDSDRCSTNENYPGRLYESYCGADGKRARETYDCPSGSCMVGACVAAESTQ